MDVHVLFGGSVERERLPQFAASGGKAVWTLTKEAKAGDTVVFYIKSPLASFVATGRVVDGRRESGDKYDFPGQPMGDVDSVELLPSPCDFAMPPSPFPTGPTCGSHTRTSRCRHSTPGRSWPR